MSTNFVSETTKSCQQRPDYFKRIELKKKRIVENKFFENLFLSDFNTGQVSHLNTVQ